MTDIHIPSAALEAGARAIYFAFTEVNIGDGEDRWDRLLPRYRAEYREQARAAFVAMIGAWPGMKMTPWWEFTTHKKRVDLILPLPQENSDDKA